jgi:hypothetical protein
LLTASLSLPLTSFADDVVALDRALERMNGPVALVGHACAGAVIAATRDARVKALVYVAALAPDAHGLIYLPEEAFAAAFAQPASAMSWPCCPPPSGRFHRLASQLLSGDRYGRINRLGAGDLQIGHSLTTASRKGLWPSVVRCRPGWAVSSIRQPSPKSWCLFPGTKPRSELPK